MNLQNLNLYSGSNYPPRPNMPESFPRHRLMQLSNPSRGTVPIPTRGPNRQHIRMPLASTQNPSRNIPYVPQTIFQPDTKSLPSHPRQVASKPVKPKHLQAKMNSLGKRANFKSINLETSEYLSANQKHKIYSTRTSELAERKLISNMSNRIKIYWKGYNYTYPFTFKQCRLERTSDKTNPLLLIERHQYNFKKVNPNQNLIDKESKKIKK